MPEWGIAIILGLVGGGLRIVLGGVFVRPQRGVDDTDNPVYRLGSLSMMIIGGAAGFLVWALATDALFVEQEFRPRFAALIVLAGVAGTEIVLNYVNRQYGVAISQEANQETGAIVEPQARAIENLTRQLSDCRERQRELREEVDKLKQGNTLES